VSHHALSPVTAADAAGVAEVVVALEASLYGRGAFSQADLEAEWLELDLEQSVRVVREMRIELPERDAPDFHTAHQEAFAT
jgi:hypothetical protein